MKAHTIASDEQGTETYRETVLQAVQEVQDNFAASQTLERESGEHAHAVTDAQRSLNLTSGLYKAGLTNYLQVITVQAELLSNQRTSVDIASRQAAASIQLFKPLRGGWDVTQLPQP